MLLHSLFTIYLRTIDIDSQAGVVSLYSLGKDGQKICAKPQGRGYWTYVRDTEDKRKNKAVGTLHSTIKIGEEQGRTLPSSAGKTDGKGGDMWAGVTLHDKRVEQGRRVCASIEHGGGKEEKVEAMKWPDPAVVVAEPVVLLGEHWENNNLMKKDIVEILVGGLGSAGLGWGVAGRL